MSSLDPVRFLRALAVAAALAVALAGARPALAEDARVERPHGVVVGDGVPQASLEACADLVEREVPLLEASTPWKPAAGRRLVVRLCPDAASYSQVVTSSGAGAFADNLAVTVDRTGESVVVLQPREDDEVLALCGGLPELTRELVAHELFHQWVLRAQPSIPSRFWWPDWFAEGMAEWCSEKTLRAGATAGVPVLFFEDRAHQVHEAQLHDYALSLPRLLHAEALEFRPIGDLYSHAWSFVRLLAGDAARFRSLLERMAAIPEPPQGSREARRLAVGASAIAALESVYGPLDALETRWRTAIGAERPRYAVTLRCAEALGPTRFLATAFAEGNALLIATQAPGLDAFTLSGRLRFAPTGTRQADLVLGYERRNAPRFVKVAIGPGYATLLAFADGVWQDRYKTNAALPQDAIPVDRDFPFALTVAGGRTRLSLDGKPVLDAPAPPAFDYAHGCYGVGCHDSAVVFDGLTVGPVGK